MKLGFDLDGCLAQFNDAFHTLLLERTGKDLFPEGYDPTDPPVWEWPTHFGYTKQEEHKCWEEVWEGGEFWQHLDIIKGEEATIDQLNVLNIHDGHEIYFITNRRGQSAQYQSAAWLYDWGMRRPAVILAKDKLPIIRALNLDAYIDDKIETANDLARAQVEKDIKTRVYLRETSHNRVDRYPNLIPVKSVWEMLEKEGLV